MTRNPKRVAENDLASEAMAMMRQFRIDEMPVVDESGQLCGIVAQADIAKHASAQETAQVVKEVSQVA